MLGLLPAGFLDSTPVQHALVVGGFAAVVAALVGVPTLLRGQAFVTDALAHVSSAGGALAPLIGINALGGFVLMSLAAALGLEAAPPRQSAERDLLTGVVFGAGLGLAALFLYLDVTLPGGSGNAVGVLFGSVFLLTDADILPAALAGGAALALLALYLRPMLLAALDPDLAAVQGVRLRRVGLAHLAALTLAVGLAAMTVGAVLSTALLVAPAAAALVLTDRPARALCLAAGLGLAGMWGGILMAWQSYVWTAGHAWPASFCIVAVLIGLNLATTLGRGLWRLGRRGAA